MLEGKTRSFFRQSDASTSGTPPVDPLKQALDDKYVDKSEFVRYAKIGNLMNGSPAELAEAATNLGGTPEDAERLKQIAKEEWEKRFGK